jgi:hypothetical protein
LVKVQRSITTAQLQLWDPQQHIHLLILCSPSVPMGVLWQLQGVLEWLHLCHSPAKVLTLYHELVPRLIAKGCTHCCELLWHEPSNTVVPFLKDQQHWLWQFSDLRQSALANFPGQISCIQNFYSLPPFMHLFFQKLFYPPL